MALIYNAISARPLSLIPKSKEELQVPDEVLFNPDFEADYESLENSLTYDQMKKIALSPDFVIIDARRPDQYEEGTIGNAININPDIDQMELFEKLANLPGEKPIVCFCDGGTCDLSDIIAEELLNLGFKRVFLYSGGWEEWQKKKD